MGRSVGRRLGSHLPTAFASMDSRYKADCHMARAQAGAEIVCRRSVHCMFSPRETPLSLQSAAGAERSGADLGTNTVASSPIEWAIYLGGCADVEGRT